MSGEHTQFEKRKQDHIELALMQENQAIEVCELDKVNLIHEALPDLDFNDIHIHGNLLGVNSKPLIVASMTAGHQQGFSINHHLINACAEMDWAMGVGSQRRELTDPDASKEWALIRKTYPEVTLYSNIGIAQVISTPTNQILKLTDSLQANGLIVHCNALQECIQPEGTPAFKGCWEALEYLIKYSEVPIIVKETGCGFSKNTLERLNQIGVSAVDISGLGGTHWGRIEGHRAYSIPMKQKAAETFRNWGIGTVSSVKWANSISPQFQIWGSGGVRHGLDAAKLFALGAHAVAFAKPMLEAALISAERVMDVMQSIEYELKVALFCTGSRTLFDLKEKISC